MDQYTKQLYVLQEKNTRKTKLKNLLESLEGKKILLKQEENSLAEARLREQEDVDKLEGISLSAIFYSITGQKEEKIEKEQQEVYVATRKYENVCAQLKAVNREIERYNYEIIELSSCEREYEQLLNEKAKYIKKIDLINGPQILKIEEQLQVLKSQCKEIDEAYSVGEIVVDEIEVIKKFLHKARNWGAYDLLGGGLICDMVKHSHLDNAQLKIQHLQELMNRYQTEITDVQVQLETHVKIEGFLCFADFFFDGLFADLAVLDQIEDSEKQINNTYKQVQEVQNQLRSMRDNIRIKMQEIHTELNQKVLEL